MNSMIAVLKELPSWFGYAVLRTLCLLPFSWLTAIGAGMGWLFGRLVRSRRHVVRVNLATCFPELGARALEQRCDAHFKALGRGGFEAVMAWWAPDWKLRNRCHVVGLEHLDAAQAEGGVVLLTGHFTTLELAARFLAMHRPFHAMYRPLNNRVFDVTTTHARERRSQRPSVPKRDLKALIRTLRSGGAVWYGPDQTQLTGRNAEFVDFFGVSTQTITATSRIAEMGRAKVVPFYPMRLPGDRYVVVIHPALEPFPGESALLDAAVINQSLEDAIRLVPEQYFWVHRRFKTRPPGAPDLYD